MKKKRGSIRLDTSPRPSFQRRHSRSALLVAGGGVAFGGGGDSVQERNLRVAEEYGVDLEEVVTLRRIYGALDVDDSGSVDEWELWSFIQAAESGMTFASMQQEMAIIDTDRNGTIEWEEMVALVFGRVAGAERLMAAVRTAFALSRKHRAAGGVGDGGDGGGGRRGSRGDAVRNSVLALAGVEVRSGSYSGSGANAPSAAPPTDGGEQDDFARALPSVAAALSGHPSPEASFNENERDDDHDRRALPPDLVSALRATMTRKMPAGAAGVVHVLAPHGSRIRLQPRGANSIDNEEIKQDLFLKGVYYDDWVTYELRKPGDGLFIGGARPTYDFGAILKQRFRVDIAVNGECGVIQRDGEKVPDNLFLVRLESHAEQIRFLALTERQRALHLWKLTDDGLDLVKDDTDESTETVTEETVTAPLAPLYFSSKMDSSLLLQHRNLMRGARELYLVHLEDGLGEGLPLHIVICTSRDGGRQHPGAGRPPPPLRSSPTAPPSSLVRKDSSSFGRSGDPRGTPSRRPSQGRRKSAISPADLAAARARAK